MRVPLLNFEVWTLNLETSHVAPPRLGQLDAVFAVSIALLAVFSIRRQLLSSSEGL